MRTELTLVASAGGTASVPCTCGGVRPVRYAAGGLRTLGPCSRCDAARYEAAMRRAELERRRSQRVELPDTEIPPQWWDAGLRKVARLSGEKEVNPLHVCRGGTFLITGAAEEETIAALRRWLEDAPEGSAYVIEGDPGRGKTHLAAAAAVDAVRAGRQVLWLDLPELALAMACNFSSVRYRQAFELVEAAMDVELVVLDGLGRADARQWRLHEAIEQLLIVRCTRRRAVLATTHLRDLELTRRMGEEGVAQLQRMALRGGGWSPWWTGEDWSRQAEAQRRLPIKT